MRLSGSTGPIIFGFLLGLRPIEIIIQEFQPAAEYQPAAATQPSEPAENRITFSHDGWTVVMECRSYS